MKKVLVLNLFASILVFLTFSLVRAAEKHTIVVENLFPESHPRVGQRGWSGHWLDAVEKGSEGLIKFERHWAGEPVTSREALDALGLGTIDMLFAYPLYYSGKIALADVLGMPKNFRTLEDFYDLWWNGPLGKIIDEVYKKRANAKFIFASPFSPSSFQVSKKTNKVRHFEDFKGLKIRSGGGIDSHVVKCIGGSPVFTIAGEYYTAMQRGTIDAGLIGNHALEAYRIVEVCHQIIKPPAVNWSLCGVLMNLDKWNKLGPELQKLMIGTARNLETYTINYITSEENRVEKLAGEKGVEVYTLPSKDQEKMWRALDPIWGLYVESCSKQGLGEEAKQLREIIAKRFGAQ